jgi:hypothetical protein
VRSTGDSDALDSALDALAALAGPEDRPAVAQLQDRLREGRLRVLVAGEAKRGKSTLVNALLGRPVLPSGVTPLTALGTVLRYGREEGVTAFFRDGRAEAGPLSALDDLVTERGNPANKRGLASVTVTVDVPLLAADRRCRSPLHRQHSQARECPPGGCVATAGGCRRGGRA